MSTTITVPENYGYVILLSLGVTPFIAFAHGVVTGSLRKAAGVPYPNCYASAEEVKAKPAAYKFNCAQRAHAQLLENMTQATVSSLVAGLVYPRATIALTAGWLVSRVLYAAGYIYGGDAKKRSWGSTFWVCQTGLWGLVCATGYQLLQ